jgi:photosystem II stability/assembly factor-like uncharacterized protein
LLGAAGAAEDEKPPFQPDDFSGLKFRSIGPAATSGRISDFAVDPGNAKRYFVAVSSGSVWRTENAGTTYEPIFDDQGSYSIGCVTLDPNDAQTVWVGTGENNSQRSVGYGDGVYKSTDGGDSWEHVGLKDSEHIGEILVDPRDSDVVYVAAQGPLWRTGGERGLYKTTDGGKTWIRILHIDDDTGINEVHMDPRDPDVLYASAYQRRRHQWVLLDGGPGSGVHKSTDGGATWTELESGLPKVDMGRIGMAISPVDPDVIYAVVEAQDDKGGLFRTTDAGASWEKRSDYNASSPQYYHELIADPVDVDKFYSIDTFLRVSTDGGKSLERVPIDYKHVDDHALWIEPTDPEHLLVGCDGGIYESWDSGKTWNWKQNLPICQFYKIAIDDDFPFYSVYGGTQDNNTLGAYVRNTSASGIVNTDWIFTLGGDGFEPAIEPGNPDIIYSQYQHGGLVRYDRRSGELQEIQPQAPEGGILKWHWSSALQISPHSPTRLYYGAQVLFRSDDRGDNWTQISPDLSRQIDRNQLDVMGRIWSVDAVAKNRSTSFWGAIVSFSESPRVEDLLYAGTDDGLVQVSEDGGANWRKQEKFDKVPEMSYVSMLFASQHADDVVYASFDNHKMGDFKPYVLRSDDRGRRWRSISGDLPERGSVNSIAEDPVDPRLLFVGTEFGVFATKDGGEHWFQLKGGVPTITVHDLAIQARENDLLLGTFGRGIYVLDDYTPLRTITADQLANERVLFDPRDAWLYVEKTQFSGAKKASFGDSFYTADNPPYGAVFTYYLNEELQKLRDTRREAEKKAQKDGGDNPYPSWDELRTEDRELDPIVLLTVRDAEGNVVRRLEGPVSKGFHRVAWDLRFAPPHPASTTPFKSPAPWIAAPSGPMVTPGTYSVSAAARVRGETVGFGEPQSFEVKWLPNETILNNDPQATLAFHKQTFDLRRRVMGAGRVVGELQERIDHVRVALRDTPGSTPQMLAKLNELNGRLVDLRTQLSGDDTIASRSEPTTDSIASRIDRVAEGWSTRMRPTGTQRQNYELAARLFAGVANGLDGLDGELTQLEAELEAIGAPWTPGRGVSGQE